MGLAPDHLETPDNHSLHILETQRSQQSSPGGRGWERMFA